MGALAVVDGQRDGPDFNLLGVSHLQHHQKRSLCPADESLPWNLRSAVTHIPRTLALSPARLPSGSLTLSLPLHPTGVLSFKLLNYTGLPPLPPPPP